MASSGGKAGDATSSSGGYFSSIFGGATAKGPAIAAARTDTNPEDIPKEDLLHLCMKMNKRMQTLEAKGAEISKKHKDVLEEKKQLLDIIKSYLTTPLSISESETIDIAALRGRVSQKSQQAKEALKVLEDRLAAAEREHVKEISAMELKMRRELNLQASKLASPTLSNGSDSSGLKEQSIVVGQDTYFTAEIERLTAENEAMASLKDDLQSKLQDYDKQADHYLNKIKLLESEVAQYDLSLKERSSQIEDFTKKSEAEKNKAEERILYLQMQLNALKAKEDVKDKELAALKAASEESTVAIAALQNQVKDGEININDYKEVIRDLHAKISDLEEELLRARGKGQELEKNSAYTTVLKAEQEAIVATLKKDLKQAISSREDYARRCRDLEDYRVKAESKLGQLSEMIQAVDEAREALEEREARITRLQSEAMVAERNHALRTAMLATAENHITTLKSDLEHRDSALAEALKKSLSLQDRLNEADEKMNKAVQELRAELDRVTTIMEDERLGYRLEKNSAESKHNEEVDQIKKDFTKKSNAARAMMSEKDAEIVKLTTLVAELKDEIASGAHNERRIFELAKSQSQREATHNLHSDTRELAFQQLQHTLATRDLELAKLQSSHAQLLEENADLRRVSRREGVNMDYLKNIIVQVLC